MKKAIMILLMTITVCAGCSGNQAGENLNGPAIGQPEAIESATPESSATKSSTPNKSNTPANAIDYGTSANEFLTSAPVHGMVTNLTDSSFVTQPAYASGDSIGEVITDVVYDPETVRFKTASVKADGSSFSVNEGQWSDLAENANVLVYGNSQDDGIFEAVEIIVVEYDYD